MEINTILTLMEFKVVQIYLLLEFLSNTSLPLQCWEWNLGPSAWYTVANATMEQPPQILSGSFSFIIIFLF